MEKVKITISENRGRGIHDAISSPKRTILGKIESGSKTFHFMILVAVEGFLQLFIQKVSNDGNVGIYGMVKSFPNTFNEDIRGFLLKVSSK